VDGADYIKLPETQLSMSSERAIESAMKILTEGMGSTESQRQAAAVAGQIGIQSLYDRGLLDESKANTLLNSARDPIAIQDAMKYHLQKIASAITEDGRIRTMGGGN